MNILIWLCYSLETGKRKGRLVEVYDPLTNLTVESELPGKLLLPRELPQQWLPAELRNGAVAPVRSWIDRSLFVQEDSDAPEGL